MSRKSLTPLKIEIAIASWNKVDGLEKRLKKAAAVTLSCLPAKLQPIAARCEFTLLLTSDAAVKKLNRDWRGLDKPTNVLSFPQYSPKILAGLGGGTAPAYVGDIAVAYQYMAAEAKKEHKILLDHLTHLMIHGILHIFGYDHMDEAEASKMEKLEIKIMALLGLPDPYQPSLDA